MSEAPKNPYSELTQEIQRRGEEIFSNISTRADELALGERITSLVAEGERRFAEMLASGQGTLPSDFKSLYEQKAELDRKLLGRLP